MANSVDENTAPAENVQTADAEAASDEPTTWAGRFLEAYKAERIPFLNGPVFRVLGIGVIAGALAIIFNNYMIQPDVKNGTDIAVRVDSFERGDTTEVRKSVSLGTLNGRYNAGARWLPQSGTGWGISEDQATLLWPAEDRPSLLVTGWLTPPTRVQARLTGKVNGAGLLFRYVDNANWWAVVTEWVERRGTLAVELHAIRNINGVVEDVGSTGDNYSYLPGQVVTIIMDDEGFDVRVEGSPIMRVNDSRLAGNKANGAGLVVMNTDGAGARWDDFIMYAVPTPLNINPADAQKSSGGNSRTVSIPTTAVGASGASGTKGATGASGVSGASAPSGPSAASGASGG